MENHERMTNRFLSRGRCHDPGLEKWNVKPKHTEKGEISPNLTGRDAPCQEDFYLGILTSLFKEAQNGNEGGWWDLKSLLAHQ